MLQVAGDIFTVVRFPAKGHPFIVLYIYIINITTQDSMML